MKKGGLDDLGAYADVGIDVKVLKSITKISNSTTCIKMLKSSLSCLLYFLLPIGRKSIKELLPCNDGVEPV